MKRFVLTGAPGSGKTSVLRVLHKRGYAVVEEAATDVIADTMVLGLQPWASADFLDRIVNLQRMRQQQPPGALGLQVFDRSPICTLALARHLDDPITSALAAEVGRVVQDDIYDRRVLFIRPIGFIEPTAARRISYEDALRFEGPARGRLPRARLRDRGRGARARARQGHGHRGPDGRLVLTWVA